MLVITAYDLVVSPWWPSAGVGESEAEHTFLDRDEEGFRRVLTHHEEQTEAVAEDEAALEDQTQTVMEIPAELVPAVRELIAATGASDSLPRPVCPRQGPRAAKR